MRWGDVLRVEEGNPHMDDTFLSDIHAQPETLRRVCAAYVDGEQARTLRAAAAAIRDTGLPVYLTGMGASYFALIAMRALLDKAGIPTMLKDTAYLLEYGRATLRPGQALIVVSQSGRTGEAVGLMQAIGDHAPLIVVTNDPTTYLAKRAEYLLPLLAKPDGGVALKTYTATLTLLMMLAAELREEPAATVARAVLTGDPMQKAIDASSGRLTELATFAKTTGYIPLLGRGPSVASAMAGALLLKETAKIAAEGASAGQFRHGAIEVVARGLLVVLFSPNGNAVSHLNAQLVRQLERSGAHVLVIGASDGTAGPNRLVLDLRVPDEYLAPLFEIVPLQFLSHALAVQRGIIPGTFVNTTPVVLTR